MKTFILIWLSVGCLGAACPQIDANQTGCKKEQAETTGCRQTAGGGNFCPQCDPNNPSLWQPTQSGGGTGTTYCVDPQTGVPANLSTCKDSKTGALTKADRCLPGTKAVCS